MKLNALLFESGLDFNNWTYVEWLIAAGALLVLVILIWAPWPRKKHKGLYVNDNNEAFITHNEQAWFAGEEGITLSLITKNRKKSPMKGEVAYYVDKNSKEKEYVTVDFVSKNEVSYNGNTYYSLQYVAKREADRRRVAKKVEKALKKDEQSEEA